MQSQPDAPPCASASDDEEDEDNEYTSPIDENELDAFLDSFANLSLGPPEDRSPSLTPTPTTAVSFCSNLLTPPLAPALVKQAETFLDDLFASLIPTSLSASLSYGEATVVMDVDTAAYKVYKGENDMIVFEINDENGEGEEEEEKKGGRREKRGHHERHGENMTMTVEQSATTSGNFFGWTRHALATTALLRADSY
jgi:hypothetical protein